MTELPEFRQQHQIWSIFTKQREERRRERELTRRKEDKAHKPPNTRSRSPLSQVLTTNKYNIFIIMIEIHSVCFIRDSDMLPIWMSLIFIQIPHMTVPYLSLNLM